MYLEVFFSRYILPSVLYLPEGLFRLPNPPKCQQQKPELVVTIHTTLLLLIPTTKWVIRSLKFAEDQH